MEQTSRDPYGRTLSYGDLAAAIGAPKAVRAVGAANGANPASIVVPVRVIGSHGWSRRLRRRPSSASGGS
jgi:O-6-methylguanine DNA methyltransferase